MIELTKQQIKAVRSTLGLSPDLRVKYKIVENGTTHDMRELFEKFYKIYSLNGDILKVPSTTVNEDVEHWIYQVYRGTKMYETK